MLDLSFDLSHHKILPTLAVESLTGCAGELLVILENVDKLLPYMVVKRFPFAQSSNDNGFCDIALVEGSVSQKHDIEKLIQLRANCRWLVAVGNCALYGCVQKCNNANIKALDEKVYGSFQNTEALPSKPIEAYVKVDVKLSGCPINATQLLSTIASLLKDNFPNITHKPVCLECKLKENPCILIENNEPCLGPITAAGCGALCPSFASPCYGCWGPCEGARVDAMANILTKKGHDLEEILSRINTFGQNIKIV